MLKRYLWIVPFLSFIGGYLLLTVMLKPSPISMPSLVGKSLTCGFTLLAPHALKARLLSCKTDPDLPDGTIVRHIPAAGKPIKPHQTVLLVISQKPAQTNPPALVGLSKDALAGETKGLTNRVLIYDVESPQPAGLCIAQTPAAHESLGQEPLIAYCARQSQKPIVWPSFIGKPLDQVIEFLVAHDIEYHVFQPRHSFETNDGQASPLPGISSGEMADAVIDQYPRPGGIYTPDQMPKNVHLYI